MHKACPPYSILFVGNQDHLWTRLVRDLPPRQYCLIRVSDVQFDAIKVAESSFRCIVVGFLEDTPHPVLVGHVREVRKTFPKTPIVVFDRSLSHGSGPLGGLHIHCVDPRLPVDKLLPLFDPSSGNGTSIPSKEPAGEPLQVPERDSNGHGHRNPKPFKGDGLTSFAESVSSFHRESMNGNEPMDGVYSMIRDVATTDAPVLFSGESGVGKSVLVQELHRRSGRSHRKIISINCAALPGDLLESELFGYERGAFTGAHRRKLGTFELAHQSTLCLDEIGELPLSLQSKLLHVLQEQQFYRLGGERPVHVDVRIVASTNRNLEEAVAKREFREDLFYRLNVINVVVPPLRERKEEIPGLVRLFLSRYSQEYDRQVPSLSPEMTRLFERYSWPGNIREMENTIKKLVLVNQPALIVRELQNRIEAHGQDHEPEESLALGLKEISRRAARKAERMAIQQALNQTQWNRVRAAKRLRISYKALLYKMEDCGLNGKHPNGKGSKGPNIDCLA